MDPALSMNVSAQLIVTDTDGTKHALPIVEGRVSEKALADGVADYVLDVTVPRWVSGVDYAPAGAASLLGCGGQTAQVEWTLTAGGMAETVMSPVYRLETVSVDRDDIMVQGRGLSAVIGRRRVLAAKQYGKANRASSVLHELFSTVGVDLQVAHDISSAIIPDGWITSTDMWTSVKELLIASRSVLRESTTGAVVRPSPAPILTQPSVTLKDGDGGTVMALPTEIDRSQRPNHVIVRGTNQNEETITAQAFEQYGPYRPDVYGWESEEIELDTVVTLAQAQLIATSTLHERARLAPGVTVDLIPDWRLHLDTAIELDVGGRKRWGHVTAVEMSIIADEAMRIEVGVYD